MNTPVDILYIIPRPEIGGAERQLLMLVRGIDRARYRPHIICLDGGGSLLDAYRNAAETVHILNRKRPLDPAALLKLVEIMHTLRPALVHTWLYIANLYGGWAARLSGVPALVVSQRGLGIDPLHSRFKTWQMRAFNLFIAQFADRLLVNARAVTGPMWNAGFLPERTRIIHNGIEAPPPIPEAQQHALREELGIRPDQTPLCAIARIDPKKDLVTMLRAIGIVAQQHPGIRLLLVGGGFPDYLKELKDLADAHGIRERVSFLGFRDDPLAILSLCKISLLSSITEGLPNAILESMLLGKPVVATRVGGIPELIENGHQGYLVPPGDPEKFADRICRLLENPALAEAMGAAGRLRAQREFSCAAMIDRTQQTYEELLTLTPGPAPFGSAVPLCPAWG